MAGADVMRVPARRLAIVAALLTATACSGDDTAPPTVGDAPEAATWTSPEDVHDRCLSMTPASGGEPVRIRGEGVDVPGVVHSPAGDAKVGVVLLPQIGPGLCGWLTYASHLSTEGVEALSVDLCGYGESTCDSAAATAPERTVAAAVAWLERERGVREVVLVGASMGGSQTVRAVAGGADVVRWANISGPSAWDGVDLDDVAGRVRSPGVIVRSRSDGSALEFGAAKRLARATGARFIAAPGGHGWDLLTNLRGRPTPLGLTLARFITSGT